VHAQPQAQAQQQPQPQQLPRTLDAAVDGAARARIDAAYEEGVARAAQAAAAHAAMQASQSIDQPNVPASHAASRSFGAAPMGQAPAQPPIPSGTIRLPPEAAQKAAAAAFQMNTPYPLDSRPKGRLDELSRGAVLLIGISLGLFVALIGLVIVILTK